MRSGGKRPVVAQGELMDADALQPGAGRAAPEDGAAQGRADAQRHGVAEQPRGGAVGRDDAALGVLDDDRGGMVIDQLRRKVRVDGVAVDAAQSLPFHSTSVSGSLAMSYPC